MICSKERRFVKGPDSFTCLLWSSVLFLLFSFVWNLLCSNWLQGIEELQRKIIPTTSHCLSAIDVVLVSGMKNTPQKISPPLRGAHYRYHFAFTVNRTCMTDIGKRFQLNHSQCLKNALYHKYLFTVRNNTCNLKFINMMPLRKITQSLSNKCLFYISKFNFLVILIIN